MIQYDPTESCFAKADTSESCLIAVTIVIVPVTPHDSRCIRSVRQPLVLSGNSDRRFDRKLLARQHLLFHEGRTVPGCQTVGGCAEYVRTGGLEVVPAPQRAPLVCMHPVRLL